MAIVVLEIFLFLLKGRIEGSVWKQKTKCQLLYLPTCEKREKNFWFWLISFCMVQEFVYFKMKWKWVNWMGMMWVKYEKWSAETKRTKIISCLSNRWAKLGGEQVLFPKKWFPRFKFCKRFSDLTLNNHRFQTSRDYSFTPNLLYFLNIYNHVTFSRLFIMATHCYQFISVHTQFSSRPTKAQRNFPLLKPLDGGCSSIRFHNIKKLFTHLIKMVWHTILYGS